MCQSMVSVVACLLGLCVLFTACAAHSPGGTHGGSPHNAHHAHAATRDGPNKLHDPRVVHDAEHIKEHYDGKAEFNESAMSPEELEFHYFQLHDFDNNTMLDGLEILKALTHMLPYEATGDKSKLDKTGKTAEQIKMEQKEEEMNYYTEIVDSVLQEDDINNDGYLTYPEYVLARRREESRERAEKRKQGKT